MPTQRIIVGGPYTYCRNPMVLGTFIASLGICVWIGSLSAIVIVMILSGMLNSYINLVEEKELAVRFGSKHLEYK